MMIFGDEDYSCPNCTCIDGLHDNPDCPDRKIIENFREEYARDGIVALNRWKRHKLNNLNNRNPYFGYAVDDDYIDDD